MHHKIFFFFFGLVINQSMLQSMDTDNKKVRLSQLLLDPNNYRFVDSEHYVKVEPENAADLRVQQRTRNLLLGKGQENVRDLITSFKNNGFLDIEAIQVKALDNKLYLVLEGNRRVATLKFLQEQYDNNIDTGRINEETFKAISVKVISGEDDKAHLIAMGLHHISGKKKWNPLNQAQMVNDLMDVYGMTEDEVCQSLGLSKQMLRRYERTLALIQAYKQSDFGDEFKSSMYSFFEETVKSPNMREWLDWDDSEMVCKSLKNQERLFSWLSHQEISVSDEENENDSQAIEEPIVEKSSDIRVLQQFISDENALMRMEKSRSVSEGYAYSDYVRRQRISSAISDLERSVEAIAGSDELEKTDHQSLIRIFEKFQTMLKSDFSSSLQKSQVLLWEIKSHFTYIDIHQFRGFRELEFKGLSRFNLLVGANNSGKTSALEAIYLFTQLNDINQCVEMEKLRGKVDGRISKNWLLYNLPEGYNMTGVFNGTKCSTKTVRSIEDSLDIDKQDYLGTLTNESRVNLQSASVLQTTMRLYAGHDNQLNYSMLMNLCRSLFTSPYRKNRDMLVNIHGKVVEMGKFKVLLDFIKENFDEAIESIELTNIGGMMRFLVKSRYNATPLELTKYGEGLQRIFEISLYMLYCADGCLFIDELDSAIHKSLLGKFVEFIDKLSREYNVQVFISSHSKECVDTMSRVILPKDLAVFRMESHETNYGLTYCNGEELKRFIENFDFDIR